jgi:exonuclease III
MLKIYGIAKLKSDIIFLSDVRLSNKNLVSAKHDIENMLRCNPYEKYSLIANSTKNKRGVAIMYKTCLDIQITDTLRSDSENILVVRASLKGSQVRLIAIYGPNSIDHNFFNELDNFIQADPLVPTIIAGDWNCTISTDNINSNIDCLNMRNPPNLNHSRKLAEFCGRFSLTDPFRFLYPEKKSLATVLKTLYKKIDLGSISLS